MNADPQGWYTHGPAPAHFPSPQANKYSLLVRLGDTPWTQATNISFLTPREPGPLIFGINDDLLGDNHGAFSVTVTQHSIVGVCRSQCFDDPVAVWGGISTRPPPAETPTARPCGDATGDGQAVLFWFDIYCGSLKSHSVAAEGCSRQEAMPKAKGLVPSGCFINEVWVP